MLITFLMVFIRIFSNSLANVYQKKLAADGLNPFFINFVMYMGLCICCLPFVFRVNWVDFGLNFWLYSILGGLFGALGNSYLVKALRDGDLSVLGPINAYKSVVAMLFGIFLLQEFPSCIGIFAIGFIILGSYFIFDTQEEGFSFKLLKRQDIRYRIYALMFTAIEAVFIKNVINQSDVTTSFMMWSFWGAVFSGGILIHKFLTLHKIKDFGTLYLGFAPRLQSFARVLLSQSAQPVRYPNFTSFHSSAKSALKEGYSLLLLILLMGLMQLSTNIVFARMNVSYALALFQLSSILSVILGWKYFKERSIKKKLAGSLIMTAGAILLILFK